MDKKNYEKKKLYYKISLLVTVVLTLCIAVTVIYMGRVSLNKEARQFSREVTADYDTLVDSYTTSFRIITGQITEKIKENPSEREMNQWLQSKEKSFQAQVGEDVYDGIAFTYKGGYVHSWNYGDYSNYDPSKRPWYEQAQKADGKIAIVAPYATYLDSVYVNDDEAIIMTIAQKYNDEICFDYDLKISQIRSLLNDHSAQDNRTKMMLYDKDGYILSSTDDEQFARNIYKNDKVIQKNLSQGVKASGNHKQHLLMKKIDGSRKLLYSSKDKNGNTLCILYPFWPVMLESFLFPMLIVLVLIMIELLIYDQNCKFLKEYYRKDRRVSRILEESYDEKVFVMLDTMEFYGNEKAEKFVEGTSFDRLYQYLYNKMSNQDSKTRFQQFLSPEILKDKAIKKEEFESERFHVDVGIRGEKKEATYEISRMITRIDEKLVVCILGNDISEDSNLLREALEKAQQASEAKGQFLAKMSHEIRTPMNAIIGETTLALRQMDSKEKVKTCLEKVMVSSRHLLNLINDILDMSSIENEKMKIAHVEFDIKEIVSTVSTLYYSQCKEKGIKFHTKLDGIRTEILVGDQLRIQQIILNLLSNAVKFTKEDGEITFTLTEDAHTEEYLNLHIRVADTGSGMSKEYMSRIFKPFEQEHALTAKEHGGSGLGLSITKNLVEMMNGTIEVQSQEGMGTEFHIVIPCGIAENQVRMDSEEISSMRAIIVDDDEDTLDYVSSILNHIGISHDQANNGELAIEMITKARNDKRMYDVCMLDWKMSGLSGLKLSEKIRKACGEDPIVMIASAYDLNEIGDEAKQAGVDICVTKPVFQSSLFNVLMALSKGKLISHTEEQKDYDFTGKRILLVDDTEINIEIAKELLEMANFEVDTATNGQEAVEIFEKSKPGTYDLILMDVQMPIMNGYEATEKIRQSSHEEAQSICVIAMTANAFAEDISKSLQAGMNDHISKPIDTELMYDVLSRHV